MNFKLSYYTVFSEIPSAAGVTQTIVYSTRTGLSLILNNEHIAAVKENRLGDLPYELANVLISLKMFVPEFEDEFVSCLQENISFIEDSDTLSYTIQPTGNCQLGCGYCGQSHSNVQMSREVMDKTYERIVHTLENAKDYKNLFVTWYGGEPLIAHQEILYLSRLLRSYCASKEITYNADIITNGLILSGEKLEVLVKECKVRAYQITIDGLPQYHNPNRPTKLGKDTFNTIFRNVKNFANSPLYAEEKCNVAIRMNINKTNAPHVTEFLDFLCEEGLNGKVTLSFHGVVDWGDNNASSNSLLMEDFAEKQIDWIFYAMDKGFKFHEIIPKRSFAVCMVADKNSEVFDATGNIYPCYELPYTPIHEKGPNLIGNLLTGQEKDTKDVPLRNWNEELVMNKDFGCSTCKFFPVCGGGCPKSWLANTIPCPPFKFNMPELLLIEYVNKRLPVSEINNLN